VLAGCVAVAHTGEVPGWEAAVFHAVNDLPDLLYRPLWVLQFPGLLLMPAVAAAAAAALHRWRLAAALLLLVPLKLVAERRVVKHLVERRRPASSICDLDLTCLHLRGDVPSRTLSFPSGHAVIVAGIAWLVLPHLPRRWMRFAAVGVAVAVMLARVYLGAHNPLDVVAGAATGVALAAGLNLAVGVPEPRAEPTRA
jgi:undecaprenyl-diphosphatase